MTLIFSSADYAYICMLHIQTMYTLRMLSLSVQPKNTAIALSCGYEQDGGLDGERGRERVSVCA